MRDDVKDTDANPPAAFSESRERILIFLLCGLAAVHVFIFSAAFPFFNNMDEINHFDLVVKYSHGHLPRGLELMSGETMQYLRTYSSPEFASLAGDFPGGRYPPPPWASSAEKTIPVSPAGETSQRNHEASKTIVLWWQLVQTSKTWQNHESAQQPLYYTLAGMWWRAGQGCGLTGLRLMYWVRFLNILFVAALVWMGYRTARMIFPERPLIRLGVPALLAFMPQTAFYSIENDVLSPLCFGAVFICLVRFLGAETPGIGLGIATGLALAATFLTKISNLPLLTVSAAVVLLKTWSLARTGKLRPTLPALAGLVFCAGLPIGCWLAWSKHAFGDFTGSAAKIQILGWTYKPFSEWWHHPIFTPHGLWTFVSDLLVTFWQGEFWWHSNPLDSPVVNALYVVPSLCFLGLALGTFLPRPTGATRPQRQALGLGFSILIAAVVFLAFLSIIFDFGDCICPSRPYPYFTQGRLMLGALIPFLLLFICGVDYLLGGIKNNRTRPLVLASMILFMLVSEIIVDRSVFFSRYNWFHL